MPTHASRLTRAGSSRSLSSSPASPLGGTGATDSVVTVHVTPRVEVLEDFSLISESASILSSSSELSRDNRTDPYRCGAVRSPPPLVRDLGAIVIYSTLPARAPHLSQERFVQRKVWIRQFKRTSTLGLHASTPARSKIAHPGRSRMARACLLGKPDPARGSAVRHAAINGTSR